MLDEYWHYAVFTLLMLIFFECTVSMTRVNNAKQLEKMEPVPQPVIIWREGKWVQMNNTGADSLEWRLPWRLDGLKWRLNCATWRLSCSKWRLNRPAARRPFRDDPRCRRRPG